MQDAFPVRTISKEDEEYPKPLKKIPDAPEILYVKGQLLPNETCFGIVGTRRCSDYGKQVALEIAGELAEAGITIVSGLAPGIDTFSHLACVEKNKRTIAVLGTGIDEKSIYPKSNIGLARKILETGGCLVSELPPGTHGSKITFPERNRIISGLSLGVLVVEAKMKSGSLITARRALEQKRKLFAVPGFIYSSNSKGTNRLIKEGAILAENSQDILKKLNLPLREKVSGVNPKNQTEALIIRSLQEGPLHVDEIIKRTKLNTQIVSTTLSVMEISGKLRNLGGNIYALSN